MGVTLCLQVLVLAIGSTRQIKQSDFTGMLTVKSIWHVWLFGKSMGKEISALINSDQLSRNCLYVSAIIDIIEFLVSN